MGYLYGTERRDSDSSEWSGLGSQDVPGQAREGWQRGLRWLRKEEGTWELRQQDKERCSGEDVCPAPSWFPVLGTGGTQSHGPSERVPAEGLQPCVPTLERTSEREAASPGQRGGLESRPGEPVWQQEPSGRRVGTHQPTCLSWSPEASGWSGPGLARIPGLVLFLCRLWALGARVCGEADLRDRAPSASTPAPSLTPGR